MAECPTPQTPEVAMIVSEARIAANRRNALLSTGPKTAEGKERSRANALKHGLCATVCVPEDLTTINARAADMFDALRPQNQYQARLVEHVAIWSVRVDRSERMERRARDKISLRAELFWEDDRKLEVEVLGGQLHQRPAQVVETLRRTPQGCDWLIGRWAMLAYSAKVHPDHEWDASQISLAYDLMGTPPEFRAGGKPGVVIDRYGDVVENGDDRAAVARRQVDELTERRAEVEKLDEAERSLAIADLSNDNDPELKRLRRYEMHLHRQIRWAVNEIRKDWPWRQLIPGLKPNWHLAPEEPAKPEPRTEDEKLVEAHDPQSWSPPFDLTPDEFPPPGQRADLPAILVSRKRKERLKAETRRHDRRRKLEKLRA
jgi:hypothetical protein